MVNLSGTTYALVGASVGTSYVLFSNFGLTQLGPVALMNGRLANVKLSAADKVKLWAAYFYPAARWSLAPTFLSLALDIFVNRTHPSELVAKLSLASGLIGATVVPYTLTFLRATNEELIELNRDDAAALAGEKGAAKAARVDELIQTWEKRHLVRYAAFVGAWGLALAALVLDGRA